MGSGGWRTRVCRRKRARAAASAPRRTARIAAWPGPKPKFAVSEMSHAVGAASASVLRAQAARGSVLSPARRWARPKKAKSQPSVPYSRSGLVHGDQGRRGEDQAGDAPGARHHPLPHGGQDRGAQKSEAEEDVGEQVARSGLGQHALGGQRRAEHDPGPRDPIRPGVADEEEEHRGGEPPDEAPRGGFGDEVEAVMVHEDEDDRRGLPEVGGRDRAGERRGSGRGAAQDLLKHGGSSPGGRRAATVGSDL